MRYVRTEGNGLSTDRYGILMSGDGLIVGPLFALSDREGNGKRVPSSPIDTCIGSLRTSTIYGLREGLIPSRLLSRGC